MIRKFRMTAFAAAMASCAMFFNAGSTIAAEIKLLASANAALKSALTELTPQFERSTGHKVTMDFASAMPLKRRIDAGETFDLVIAPALVDDLVKQGKVAADTRIAFTRTGLGVGVHKGAPKPDISSVEAFKRTLLNAKSVGSNSESEPGTLFLAILDRLVIAQDVRPRLKEYQTLAEMGAALERREVDIVVSSTTNLREAPTIDVTGFPSEIQRYLVQVAGVSASSKEPEATKALLRFLQSPDATSVLKTKGFERD
jgi:molybdate transport system substrate-binding protein